MSLIPGSRRNSLLQVAIVAVLCVAAMAIHQAAPTIPYDGGISASSGTFIRAGLVPYRDFWLLYGPLSGYLVAASLLLAPPSIGMLQAMGMVTFVAQAVAGYLLIRRQTTAVVAAAIAVLAVAAPAFFLRLELGAWPLAMSFALGALALAESPARRGPLAAGLLTGIAFLSRLDVGAYALVALLVTKRTPGILVGFLAVATPATVAAVLVVPAEQLVEQLIWYPVVGPRLYRGLPITSLASEAPTLWSSIVVGWLPRAAVVLTGVLVLLRRRQGLGALVFFALMCQLQTIGRADLFHLAQAAGPALLLTAAWFPPRPRLPWAWAVGVAALLVSLGSLAALSAGYLIADDRGDKPSYFAAAEVARDRTAPGEPIFVGLTSNRYTFINPLIVYYLADRPPGTRLTMYNPGVTNTDKGQQEMVHDLESSGTRVFVLDRTAAELCEVDNLSCVPGSTVLDSFLSTGFEITVDLDEVVVLTRR